MLPMDLLPQDKINRMAEVLSLLALLSLHSHKSTNPRTKVQILTPEAVYIEILAHLRGFTCFTGTKVQILTPEAVYIELLAHLKARRGASELLQCLHTGTQFTCFAGTKIQILTRLSLYNACIQVEETKAHLQVAADTGVSSELGLNYMHVCMYVCMYV